MSTSTIGSGVVQAVGVSDVPDPEVVPKAKARTFAASYKKRVLAEFEALPKSERGAFLRREGLYSTLIRKWQAQAARGAEDALVDRARGPKPADASAKQIAGLQAQVGRLEAELADSRRIADVQAKLFALLDDLSKRAPEGDRSKR